MLAGIECECPVSTIRVQSMLEDQCGMLIHSGISGELAERLWDSSNECKFTGSESSAWTSLAPEMLAGRRKRDVAGDDDP